MRSFKFECKDQYSLALSIDDNECFSGKFTIDNQDNEIQTSFSGIGLRLEENLYSLSFIVSWKHLGYTDRECYTAFNGEISFECNNSFCLALNWLLVSESNMGTKPIKNSGGKSKLYETIFDSISNQNAISLPFPNHQTLFAAEN